VRGDRQCERARCERPPEKIRCGCPAVSVDEYYCSLLSYRLGDAHSVRDG